MAQEKVLKKIIQQCTSYMQDIILQSLGVTAMMGLSDKLKLAYEHYQNNKHPSK